MAAANRPATLVAGWSGAWGLNVRRALAAIRDEGPLTLQQVTQVLRQTALHSDLTSGHHLGPMHGAEMLAQAIIEDAAAIITVDADGRYSVPADLTWFTSPYTGQNLKLLTVEEQAAAKAVADAERPVRRWSASDCYSPFGGAWVDGQLPGRKWTPDDVEAKAEEIEKLGWLQGARIVKDQRGVIIDGHLRDAALRWLARDPDTGVDPRSGEPYVEIRAFNNDAARLEFALRANWSSISGRGGAPTRKQISHQVLGDQPLTLDAVTRLIRPLAEIMATPAAIVGGPEPGEALGEVVVEPVTVRAVPLIEEIIVGPVRLNDDDLDMIAAIDRCGHYGATQAELRLSGDQGATTGRLSRLTDGGHIVKLDQKRDRSAVYVTPKWVADRPLGKRRGDGPTLRAVPVPVPALPPAVYSNEQVAAMPWQDAVPAARKSNSEAPFVQKGRGRIYAQTGARADAPVADHIDGIIADLTAKTPWLLPMICERISQLS